MAQVCECGIAGQLLLAMDCVNDALIKRHVSFMQKCIVNNQQPIWKFIHFDLILILILAPSFFPPSIPGVTRWVDTYLFAYLFFTIKNIYIVTAHCTMLWYCAALYYVATGQNQIILIWWLLKDVRICIASLAYQRETQISATAWDVHNKMMLVLHIAHQITFM